MLWYEHACVIYLFILPVLSDYCMIISLEFKTAIYYKRNLEGFLSMSGQGLVSWHGIRCYWLETSWRGEGFKGGEERPVGGKEGWRGDRRRWLDGE